MILLGSTGSIGVNTLAIVKRFHLHVDVLVAGRNIKLLNEQIALHHPRVVVVALKQDILHVRHKNVLYGEDAILRVIEESNTKLVINALVGFLGLRPTLKAIECGKRVALANKESLVAAGAFVDTSKIQPIDSEHFGLWYLLQNKEIHSMTITASGGAFRDWNIKDLSDATLQDTQKHPNWSMGEKITIDSATMVNKMFELLEARWLFKEGRYDAIIETKSVIHALINFKDGSTTAHLANTSMQLPISYAIMGKVKERILEPIDLIKIATLEFKAIDTSRYAVWQIKDELLTKPRLGVVVNAANEAAIKKFISKKSRFLDISKDIIKAFEKFKDEPNSLDEIFEIDKEVRHFVEMI